MKEIKYPKSFSHIGITVPDIHKAVNFYQDVMGWYVIMAPSKVKKERDTAIGQMCIDVFGEDWDEFEIAHLSTSDGIGVELFSFPNPPARPSRPEAQGLRHLCFAVDDVAATVVWLTGLGIEVEPIRIDPYTEQPFTFFADPDGLPLEIYQRSSR